MSGNGACTYLRLCPIEDVAARVQECLCAFECGVLCLSLMVLQPGLYVQCCLMSYPESRTLTLARNRKPYMSLMNRCEVHVKPLQVLMILRPTPSPHKLNRPCQSPRESF